MMYCQAIDITQENSWSARSDNACRQTTAVLTRSGPIFRLLAFLLLAQVSVACFAGEPALPKELVFLPKYCQPYHIADGSRSWEDTKLRGARFGDNRIQAAMNNQELSGRYWNFALILAGAKTREAVIEILKRSFLENGWTLFKEWPDTLLWHYTQGGIQAWAITGTGDQERGRLEMFEIAPPPVSLTLTPPSALPEKLDAAGDFPFLTKFPGSTFRVIKNDANPFSVTLQAVGQPEMVATGSVTKVYDHVDDVSNSLFRYVYHDALTKAGWTIVDERQGSDAIISAHYAQNGRNLWATLHKSDVISIQVADAGKDLAGALKKDCHVALYGILFDFNKSTLQPVSEPMLQQIAALLKKDAALRLEIQGHTDNVGNDDYNQNLSESRAHAVVDWLTRHGIQADRLSSKGYGKKVPVADNGTDEGRAKNRRVEIADPRCAAKGT